MEEEYNALLSDHEELEREFNQAEQERNDAENECLALEEENKELKRILAKAINHLASTVSACANSTYCIKEALNALGENPDWGDEDA